MSSDLCLGIQPAATADEDIILLPSSSTSLTGADASSCTPNQLQILLKHEKQKYCILRNESTKPLASWWRSFGYPAVLDENNQFQRIPGFISCVKCCHTSTYGPTVGTKRFLAHANRCFPLSQPGSPGSAADDSHSTQLTLSKNVIKQKVKLSNKEQNEIKDLYAKWVCGDIRPYSIVEDKGFVDLAQMFIRIGAQHGLVDVNELLRSRQTVSRTVNELALKYRLNLKNELIEPLKSKAVTICSDFWSNKYTQQSFLGLNMTYVTEDHEFISIDLFCIPFNGIKSHDSILSVLRRQLSEYGIIDLSEVHIVTDRGANFVKAFALYNPLYCVGHRLNNVLKICFFQVVKKNKDQNHVSSLNDHSTTTTIKRKTNVVISGGDSSSDDELESSEFDEENYDFNVITEDTLVHFHKKKSRTTAAAAPQKMSIDDVPLEGKKILLLLRQTKDLVKYVKQAGLNPEIKAAGGVTLHQATVVRWLSLSDLLESVVKSFRITKRLLVAKQKQALINDLNEQCLKQLIVLLKPFKNMMVMIQRGNAPSLHLVSLCYITLKELLSSYDLLKQYNEDNRDEGEDDRDSALSYDDDVEHELPGIKWFRERLLSLLKEMLTLDIRHVAATLLHPRYRCLKKFPDHIKNQCHRYVRRQVRRLRDEAQIEIQYQEKSLEPPKKRFKNGRNLFSRFESQNFDEEVKGDGSSSGSEEFDYDIKKGDELDRYLLFEFEKKGEDTDPLEFWKSHRNQFPFLAQYARSLLSIPATSTNVEREFSTAGWILNQRRTNLKPEQVDKILFVRSMGKHLEKKHL